MPHLSSIPLHWRLKKSKYNLVGTKCTNCNKVYFPPRTLCPDCRSKGKVEDYKFEGKGKILTHTVIRVAPAGFEKQAPYAVGIIELENGVKISGQIVGDITKIKTGMNVRAVFRKMFEDGDEGFISYGLKWELEN